MRTIKFRGISKKTGQFIYGMPTHDFKYIFDSDNIDSPDNYEVIPETVGQFTGYTDSCDYEVYEGDIPLKYNVIEFSFGAFNINGDIPLVDYRIHKKTIIGNIHQNPELIK